MKQNRRSSSRKGYFVFLLPGLALFLLVVIGPLLVNLGLSFTRWQGIGAPLWVGLANYRRALGDELFWTALRNNLALLLAVALIPTLVGLLLSVFLFETVARKIAPGAANFLIAGFGLSHILPLAVAGVVWKWIFQPDWGAVNWALNQAGLAGLALDWLGSSDSALGSVMAMFLWFQVGCPLALFYAAQRRIHPDLWAAAALEGAAWPQRFYSITLPQIRPAVFAALLAALVWGMGVFDPLFVMTRGGPGTATLTLSYYAYQNFFEKADVGYGAALSTLLAAAALSLGLLSIRILRREASDHAR